MPTALEAQFHQAMLDIYENAKRECNYNATRFLRMVNEIGGLAAARQLINAPEVSDGFSALWEHGRLDLTVECHALRDEFRPLFTDDELARAKERLVDMHYTGPEVQ